MAEHVHGALAQLDEIDGGPTKVVDPADRDQRQGGLAATEPGFDFAVENGQVQPSWQNLDRVQVHFYRMDVELLFSRSPFVQQQGGQFTAIRPNLTREVKLGSKAGKRAIPLPDELARQNVLVEVTAAGKSRTAAYYANVMDVKFLESYGQVRGRCCG
ncbi:MAG: hypothetical protein U0736_03135 [Gemmataceae bacterium]